jgi:hypothetical protein
LIGTDPGGEQAQEVADRWLALAARSYAGDPDVQTDSMTAWMDREHWLPAMKRKIAAFNLEEVTAFIKQAAISSPKQYFSEEAWATYVLLRDRSPEEVSRSWQAFRDVESALGQDPAGEPAQALVRLDGADGRDERRRPRRKSGADEEVGRPAALAGDASVADGRSLHDVGRAV